MAGWFALLSSLVLLWGSAVHAADRHEYTVTVDYRLSQLWVEARFASPVKNINAKSRSAGEFLLDVRGCDDPPTIWLRNRSMLLPAGGIECLNYTVDLEKAAKKHRGQRALAPGNVIVSSSLWLWRPRLSGSSEIMVRFRLPEDMRVSVPWQQAGSGTHHYLIRRSPESSNAPIVFGNFHAEDIRVQGATLRVSMLNGRRDTDFSVIADWLRATAADVSLAYGRFPNPSPQVVVIPVDGGRKDTAVPFGRVIRDGGESVELYINQNQPLQAYLDDWTATHEFSHLMLPYVGNKHRWVSEGFAQYYQNVLLARSGAYDELHAWQKLYEGFERGRDSRPELSPNEAAESERRSGLMKVYWAGAAIAFMADVELRERSNGEQTLDQLLDQFQACCLPSNRVWSGTEFFRKLDSFAGEPVFMPLYRRYANAAGFPDTRPLFEQLGLAVSDGKVRMRRRGDLIDIRGAITKVDENAAAWRKSIVLDNKAQRQSAEVF